MKLNKAEMWIEQSAWFQYWNKCPICLLNEKNCKKKIVFWWNMCIFLDKNSAIWNGAYEALSVSCSWISLLGTFFDLRLFIFSFIWFRLYSEHMAEYLSRFKATNNKILIMKIYYKLMKKSMKIIYILRKIMLLYKL